MKKTLFTKAMLFACLTLFACASSANAQIIVDDTFDDGDLTTNTNGIGTGFTPDQPSLTVRRLAEAGGQAVFDNIANGGSSFAIHLG